MPQRSNIRAQDTHNAHTDGMPLVVDLPDLFTANYTEQKRKIRVLLPHDYFHNTRKSYPVLYLQDGQNLIADGSPFGSWRLDEVMAALYQKERHDVILVAIDHLKEQRIAEFSPYASPASKHAFATEYLNFLSSRLKPFIDDHFRTQPDAENTGIGGSSMGGLFTFFAGLHRPDIFGRWMIFSPSLFVAHPLFHHKFSAGHFDHCKAYLYAGGKEGIYMKRSMDRLEDFLLRECHFQKSQIKYKFNLTGKHQEKYWGRAFRSALPWLF